MAESSTPNPFEPDLPGPPGKAQPEKETGDGKNVPDKSTGTAGKLNPILPGEAAAQPQKLKLKQILTPLSPHLTAPRPEADERVASRKSFTPSPKAVPVEPEPELTEEELAAREKAGGPKPETTPPETEGPPPATGEQGPEPEQDPSEDPAEKEDPEEAKKKTAGKKGPEPQPKPKSRKLLLALALPAVLLLAIAYLVNHLFDPLGLTIQPIEELPDLTALQQASQAKSSEVQHSDSSQLVAALEEETVTQYLSMLEENAVLVLAEPDGLFINAVYVGKGMVINPRYGLHLVSVDSGDKTALLEDAKGNSYRVAIR